MHPYLVVTQFISTASYLGSRSAVIAVKCVPCKKSTTAQPTAGIWSCAIRGWAGLGTAGCAATAPDLGGEVIEHEKPYWEGIFTELRVAFRPGDVFRDWHFATACSVVRSTGDTGSGAL